MTGRRPPSSRAPLCSSRTVTGSKPSPTTGPIVACPPCSSHFFEGAGWSVNAMASTLAAASAVAKAAILDGFDQELTLGINSEWILHHELHVGSSPLFRPRPGPFRPLPA